MFPAVHLSLIQVQKYHLDRVLQRNVFFFYDYRVKECRYVRNNYRLVSVLVVAYLVLIGTDAIDDSVVGSCL